MDTEGLAAAFEGNEDHDLYIFCLALFTCSHFVYNSKNTIDRDAISKFSMVVEIAKSFYGENSPSE